MKMKTIAGFHILFFVLSIPVILDLANYVISPLKFYREYGFNAADGYPDVKNLLPYFVMTMIVAAFPISLISTLPRAISVLLDRRFLGMPSWTALIRMFICGFGFLFSLFFVVVSAERGDVSLIGLLSFSLASMTAALILGAKIYSDPRLQARREQSSDGKPDTVAS